MVETPEMVAPEIVTGAVSAWNLIDVGAKALPSGFVSEAAVSLRITALSPEGTPDGNQFPSTFRLPFDPPIQTWSPRNAYVPQISVFAAFKNNRSLPPAGRVTAVRTSSENTPPPLIATTL